MSEKITVRRIDNPSRPALIEKVYDGRIPVTHKLIMKINDLLDMVRFPGAKEVAKLIRRAEEI